MRTVQETWTFRSCVQVKASSVNGNYRGRLGRLLSFSWSSSQYIVGVDKEDIRRRHSSHFESGHWS